MLLSPFVVAFIVKLAIFKVQLFFYPFVFRSFGIDYYVWLAIVVFTNGVLRETVILDHYWCEDEQGGEDGSKYHVVL